MNALWTLAVMASLLFAWICVVHIIPGSLMCMFRQRLWHQRDELAAEIRAGRFNDSEPAECLIDLMERYIRFAPEFSAFRVTIARTAARFGDVPPPEPFSIETLLPAERLIMGTYMANFNETVADHVLFETPSGWLLILLSVLILPLMLLFEVLGGRGVRRPLDDARRSASEGSMELARSKRFAAA
jgi:hypothetical protein